MVLHTDVHAYTCTLESIITNQIKLSHTPKRCPLLTLVVLFFNMQYMGGHWIKKFAWNSIIWPTIYRWILVTRHFYRFFPRLTLRKFKRLICVIYPPIQWCIKSINNEFAIAIDYTLKAVPFGFCLFQVMPLFRIFFWLPRRSDKNLTCIFFLQFKHIWG